MDERGPFVGHQTKPRQLRPSRVTVEHIEQGEGDAQVSGLFDVSIAGATWRQRPEYGEAIEQEIEDAIRGVLVKYVCSCPCHQGGVILHVVPCCENYVAGPDGR